MRTEKKNTRKKLAFELSEIRSESKNITLYLNFADGSDGRYFIFRNVALRGILHEKFISKL